jgi:hypothetical protein
MENLTVIIPIIKLDNEEQKTLFVEALSSVDDSNIIIVGDADALNSISDVKTEKMFMTIENKTGETNYAAQVNFAVKKVNTDYFAVLEYDDKFSPIWFTNVKEYIEKDVNSTFAFMPLTEIVDYTTKIPFGYANEAVWATSFSDEIGYYDIQALEQYLNFNASGAVFKTDDFKTLGMLKPSMKLVFWYEFLLRALYKGKKIFVIPKVGYYHIPNRPGSITNNYAENMSEKEADWWINLAKKEYYFVQDRNKTYVDEE